MTIASEDQGKPVQQHRYGTRGFALDKHIEEHNSFDSVQDALGIFALDWVALESRISDDLKQEIDGVDLSNEAAYVALVQQLAHLNVSKVYVEGEYKVLTDAEIYLLAKQINLLEKADYTALWNIIFSRTTCIDYAFLFNQPMFKSFFPVKGLEDPEALAQKQETVNTLENKLASLRALDNLPAAVKQHIQHATTGLENAIEAQKSTPVPLRIDDDNTSVLHADKPNKLRYIFKAGNFLKMFYEKQFDFFAWLETGAIWALTQNQHYRSYQQPVMQPPSPKEILIASSSSVYARYHRITNELAEGVTRINLNFYNSDLILPDSLKCIEKLYLPRSYALALPNNPNLQLEAQSITAKKLVVVFCPEHVCLNQALNDKCFSYNQPVLVITGPKGKTTEAGNIKVHKVSKAFYSWFYQQSPMARCECLNGYVATDLDRKDHGFILLNL